ncbi:MAG: tetratricopeptide repeat protein, partial [Deltaproteobacteria bacterium]
AVQKEFHARNAELPENRRMVFRIGINLGDVIQEGDRIYGDGVNIAARLESLADPGGICVSKTAFDQIETKLPLGYEYLGEQTVKNIAKPVGAYRVLMEPRVTVAGEREEAKLVPLWRRKSILAGAVAVLVLVVAALIWDFYFRPPPIEPASLEKMAYPLPDKPSIAVLPFENLSGDPEQEYIANGITENIITGLSQIPDMFVIARNSVFTYKGKPVKIKQVSEELGVRYVLEGSVQRSGDRLRLTGQLIDAIKGHHLWAERYDRELKDLFALQDEVTLKILAAMQVKLTVGESPMLYGTDNFEAWGHFVRGFSLLNRGTKEDILKARKHFKQATKLDPDYAQAWNNLASTHCLEVVIGVSKSPAVSIKRALQLTQKAAALGGVQAYIHNQMNRIYMLQGQYDKAIAEGERAVILDPNSARSHIFLAMVLHYAGRPEEAIVHAKKAMRLEPYYQAWFLSHLAGPYEMVGRHEEAIAIWEQFLERALKGEFPAIYIHERLALNYARLDRMEEARAQAAEILKIKPDYTVEFYRTTTPYKDHEYLDSLVDLLIKAGLPEHPPLPLPDKPSIAVLPFTNMSEDPKQEYFSDGMTEEIIMGLSKVPELFVIARNSTFVYKGKPVNIQQVSKELGVRYVLEGSVRKAADRVRITAQLIDATTGDHVWSDRYDRDLKDIFALQDEITMKIMTALQVKLTEGQAARLTARGTKNLEAYMKCLEAREHSVRFNKESNALAREKLKEAIALDPNYPAAYRYLGGTHFMDIWLRTTDSPKRSMGEAIKFLKKAISLDPLYGDAHGFLGFFLVYARQYEKAVTEAEKGVALCPSSAGSYGYLGSVLRYVGRSEEAIQAYKKALRLNPFPPTNWIYGLGIAYLFTGQCEQAIEQCLKAVHLEPESVLNHITLTAVYGACGREEDARSQAKELLKVQPEFSVEYFGKRLTYKNDADKELILNGLRKAGLK